MENQVLYIGIPADYLSQKPHDAHSVGNKYVRAVTDAMHAVPLLLPALAEHAPLDAWLDIVDGIVLTGSYSNVEPHHYQGPASAPGTLHDPRRDATTLALISKAVERDIPLLGICRGFQEINVALGGSLHQQVKTVPNLMDHTEDKSLSFDQQYAPVHPVTLEPNGVLSQWLKTPTTMVNSLHEQGVERLADSLKAEARAEDGLIEAFSLKDPERFVLGVQWHPEWKVTENPSFQAVFAAFRRACQERKTKKTMQTV